MAARTEAPVQPTPPPVPPTPLPVPPTPPRQRSAWLLPLVASLFVLVVLVGAIVVMLAIRQSSVLSGRDAPAASCPVGRWSVTEYTEKVAVKDVGDVTFVGKGAEVRLRSDGTGVTDYKDGTVFTATINGIAYRLVVTGQVTYSYHHDAGKVTFSDVKAQAKETLTRADNGESVSDDLPGQLGPARYTCSGNAMTEYTDEYTAVMTRLSATG